MSIQVDILRACNHTDRPRSEVLIRKGETILTCTPCWNESVHARRAERKQQLAAHWQQERERQDREMQAVGATIGQKVYYFAPSMLGGFFGGITVTGTIARNRNQIAVIRLDEKHNGERYTQWTKAWRPRP